MALSKYLEIYKAADALLSFALRVQTQVPRAYRVAVGQKVCNECVEILLSVARANAARGPSREQHIATLLEQLEGITALLRASHSHHDRARVAQVLRRRGHAVEGDLSKIYRSNA